MANLQAKQKPLAPSALSLLKPTSPPWHLVSQGMTQDQGKARAGGMGEHHFPSSRNRIPLQSGGAKDRTEQGVLGASQRGKQAGRRVWHLIVSNYEANRTNSSVSYAWRRVLNLVTPLTHTHTHTQTLRMLLWARRAGIKGDNSTHANRKAGNLVRLFRVPRPSAALPTACCLGIGPSQADKYFATSQQKLAVEKAWARLGGGEGRGWGEGWVGTGAVLFLVLPGGNVSLMHYTFVRAKEPSNKS